MNEEEQNTMENHDVKQRKKVTTRSIDFLAEAKQSHKGARKRSIEYRKKKNKIQEQVYTFYIY